MVVVVVVGTGVTQGFVVVDVVVGAVVVVVIGVIFVIPVTIDQKENPE